MTFTASETVAVYDRGQDVPNPDRMLTGLMSASTVAVDVNDNVYAASREPARVMVFDKGATTADSAKELNGFTAGPGIIALAFDSLGRTYVSAGDVDVFDPNQTTPDPAKALVVRGVPSGLAIDTNGTVFVGNSPSSGRDNIQVFPSATPPAPDFDCTSGPQVYTVPAWATSLSVDLRGAMGGGAAGGNGGKASARVAVEPGSSVQVNVGCQPEVGNAQIGGFNGGANAGDKKDSTGTHLGAYFGGGGATDIRVGDCAATGTCLAKDRVLIAGGGGGGETRADVDRRGGAGGNPTGASGTSDPGLGVGSPGQGGTASAGGTGGTKATASGGTNGSTGAAGVGGSGGASSRTGSSGPGAGGGGGLFGGGGGGSGNAVSGSGIGGAGGGGSSGVGPAGGGITSGTSFTNGSVNGNGAVTITPRSAPLVVDTTELAEGAESTPYSQQLNASGGVPGYTWALDSGSLPAGLTLSPGGEIQGTPTTQETANFTVKVEDAGSQSATKALSIAIDGGIAITTGSLPDASRGVGYSQTLTASGGGGAASWAVTAGSLPPGLTLDSGTGKISGAPTTVDTFPFTVTVTGADSSTATAPLKIHVTDELAIVTGSNLPTAEVTAPYSLQLRAVGGVGPYTWDRTTPLPAGLSLDTGGMLSGTPSGAARTGFTVRVTDSLTTRVSKQVNLVVEAKLAINTSALPAGTVGVAYDQTLATSGGVGPLIWRLTNGSLPAGLSLEQHSGAITGTPVGPETRAFTVAASDSLGVEATDPLAIAIAAAPVPPPSTASVQLSGVPTQVVVKAPTRFSAQVAPSNATGSVAITANNRPVCTAALSGGVASCTGKISDRGTAAVVATFTGTVDGSPVTAVSPPSRVSVQTVALNKAKIKKVKSKRKIVVNGLAKKSKQIVTVQYKSGGKWTVLGKTKSTSSKRWSLKAVVKSKTVKIRAKTGTSVTAVVKVSGK